MNANALHRLRLFPGFVLAALLLLAVTASAQEKFDFKTHPFFKRLIGEWITKGEIKIPDGRIIPNEQHWKAELSVENSFTITGTRDLGGQITHYRWAIKHLDSGIFEQVFQADINDPHTLTFEARTTEDGSQITMTGLMDHDEKSTIIQGFRDGDPDTLDVKLTMTDGSGAIMYSSTAVSVRQKTP